MRKLISLVVACVFAISILCANVVAMGVVETTSEQFVENTEIGLLATGSFNMSVAPHRQSEANKALPLAAGEKVKISALYTPENSSMDFGLIDPDGVFHYFTVTGGSAEKTIRVSESGNYTFAIRNNSGVTVKVSGFLTY